MSRLNHISFAPQALLLAGIIVLFCLVDFVQRVWLSGPESGSVGRELAEAQMLVHNPPQVSASLQSWWQQREQEKQAASAANQQQTEAETPLLEGGIDVGPLRIRLRAIVIAAGTQQQVAIMEAQNTEDRSLTLIERRVGEALGAYEVTAIRVNEIIFSQGEDTIAVPIFDYDR